MTISDQTKHPLSPGAYLRKRREAAGIELEDLALMLDSDPAVSALSRAELLASVERGETPVTEDLVRAVLRLMDNLRSGFRLDPVVWVRLIGMAAGDDIAPPRLCAGCACSELDPCIAGEPGQQTACHWVAADLCSACAPAAPAKGNLPVTAQRFDGFAAFVPLDRGNGFTTLRAANGPGSMAA